jgi:hypothetical protein
MLFTMAIQRHLGLGRSYNDELLTFLNDVEVEDLSSL